MVKDQTQYSSWKKNTKILSSDHNKPYVASVTCQGSCNEQERRWACLHLPLRLRPRFSDLLLLLLLLLSSLFGHLVACPFFPCTFSFAYTGNWSHDMLSLHLVFVQIIITPLYSPSGWREKNIYLERYSDLEFRFLWFLWKSCSVFRFCLGCSKKVQLCLRLGVCGQYWQSELFGNLQTRAKEPTN